MKTLQVHFANNFAKNVAVVFIHECIEKVRFILAPQFEEVTDEIIIKKLSDEFGIVPEQIIQKIIL